MAKDAAPPRPRTGKAATADRDERESRGPERTARRPRNRPPDQLARLRAKAKSAGILIRTRRGRAGSDERRYSLVDSATNEVLAAGIRDLDGVAVELWRRIRERAIPATPEPEEQSEGVCSNCGTRRLGAFRYCRKCGLDFEPAPAATLDPAAVISRPVFVLGEQPARPVIRIPEPAASFRTATESATAADQALGPMQWLIEVIAGIDWRLKVLTVLIVGLLIGVGIPALLTALRF